jgi:hypothetical protein
MGAIVRPVIAWTRRTNAAFFDFVSRLLEDFNLHRLLPHQSFELPDALLGGPQLTGRHDVLIRRHRRGTPPVDQMLPAPND